MTLNITSPCPFVLEAPRDGAAHKLAQLHRFAQEAAFPKMTSLMRMHKDECMVSGDDDPLELMKLYAKGLAYDKGKVYAVTPDEFWAFGVQLPNGRIAIFGLALYPEFVETKDGLRQTPWTDVAHWSGSVCVCAADQTGHPVNRLDKESARLVASVLMQAHHLGILKKPEPDSPAACRHDELMACV